MKMAMRRVLKVLNPIIWLINVFMYFSWLELHKENYQPYDFSNDLKYF